MSYSRLLAMSFTVAISIPAAAQSPRDLLVSAAFAARDKPNALAQIGQALKAADATLARDPANREAMLQRSIALGYRGQLSRSIADAKAAHAAFERLVASKPSDAEAQLALAGFHLGTIIEVGAFIGRTALGARKAEGLKALDRAVALGGNRAFFPAYASFLRIRVDPTDIATARRLAEAAGKANAPTPVDRITQKYAAALLVPLRAGDGKAAAALSRKLMAFGRFS